MAVATEAISQGKTFEDNIRRFDVHQIVQHAVLMVSFIILVLTGLPLKFNTWAVSQWWASIWGGIDVIRTTHHVMAWTIVLVCLYHLVYIGYSTLVLKRPFPVKMVPSYRDVVDFAREMGYYMGLRKEKPEIDRFNWKEKFDYWAIFWGMPVMAISGFILMYPVLVTGFLPGWVVPAALVAHSDEAMLALTWIFIVHIFFNHLTPGAFPLNTTIFTGRMSTQRYRQEHSLEYAMLTGTSKEEEED